MITYVPYRQIGSTRTPPIPIAAIKVSHHPPLVIPNDVMDLQFFHCNRSSGITATTRTNLPPGHYFRSSRTTMHLRAMPCK